LCKSLGVSDVTLFDFSSSGDLGSAGALFDLASYLEVPSDEPLVCVGVEVGSGAQGCVVSRTRGVAVVAQSGTPTTISYVEYLQRFGVLAAPAPPTPIVPWSATPGAARDDLEGSLSGSRCSNCGSLNVPPRRICSDCRSTEFTLERAPRRGHVVTYSVQHVVAVHPEPTPVAVGVIRFEGEGGERGGQVSGMFCDSDLTALHVGQLVELVYRRIGLDDGLVKYGWKFRVVNDKEPSMLETK
jgi:uncharacterized OB-fold protein